MDEQLSYPMRITGSRLRLLIPFVSGVVVLVVFLLMLYDFPSSKLTRSASAVTQNNDTLILKPFAWLSGAFAVNILMLATLSTALYVFWQEAKRVVFYIIVGLVVASALVFGVALYDQQTFIELPLGPVLSITETMAKPSATRWMDCLAWCETLMLVAALCSLCTILPANASDLRNHLFRRKRFATWLLYVAAFTLTVSVVQVSALFRLPANAVALHLTLEQLNALTAGITMFIGTYFTLLLLAIFSPVFVIVNAEIQALAVSTGNARSATELDDWLKKNGLTGSWKQHLPHLAALLGPLLAGWLGDSAVRALAM